MKDITENCGYSPATFYRQFRDKTVSLTCEWILGKYEGEPEELAEIYEQSVPQPLLPYLKEESGSIK